MRCYCSTGLNSSRILMELGFMAETYSMAWGVDIAGLVKARHGFLQSTTKWTLTEVLYEVIRCQDTRLGRQIC